MFNKKIKILILVLICSTYSISQNLKINGLIKERVDKFDKKGNIKENDFDIINVKDVNISIYTKSKNIASTKCSRTGEYLIEIDASNNIYYLKIDKAGYLPKISEMDLTKFTSEEILNLEEWDFGIRKNTDNVTSPILNRPFERYYYYEKTGELILDEDYGYEYQIAFGDAIFTQIEEIQKETEKTDKTDLAIAKAKDIITTANRNANQILENAKDLKRKIIEKENSSATSSFEKEIAQIRNNLDKEYKRKNEKYLKSEKKKIYSALKDSILDLANNSIINEEEKTTNNKQGNNKSSLISDKFQLYAKRQKLEIDRLKAITKEDSLLIQLREEEINSAESEIRKTEADILVTKSKLETEHKELLLQKSEIKNQQNIIIIISLLIIFILVAAIFIYKSFNEKKQYALVLEKQNGIIAQKNDSIMASIKYAKRIQDSILPRKEIWNEIFEKSFILFMPKDVVSGDFYWMHKVSKHEVLFAAVDCTGHGVPGGFMSIVGYHSLHRAINEFHFKEPAKILDSMQVSVNAVLRQGFGEGTIKDGMDIALCSLNTETKVLQYSGAYNPLWILRGDDIISYKATKQAVGSFTETHTPFENHEIKLQKNDTIYIFSDGFADQFGGPNGKKIMSRGLKKILLENKELPIEKQKIFLKKYFYSWMNEGEEDQVDDVCILAVKI